MKYTRAQVHAVRQSLNEAYDKIEKVFESIENPAHYNVFYNMCQCVIRICTVWSKRLMPKRPYSLYKEQDELYQMFSSTAMDVVEKMNNLIDIYTSAEADEVEYMRKYAETEERLRMEREIVEKEALKTILIANKHSRGFHFYGKQAQFWENSFDLADVRIRPNASYEEVALTVVYNEIDEFVDELKNEISVRSVVPHDVYLIYDDECIYKQILSKLNY